jgi:hypothetical protein
MQINNVMGVTIGPGGYFLNFTQFGLQINAGHEVTATATATNCNRNWGTWLCTQGRFGGT